MTASGVAAPAFAASGGCRHLSAMLEEGSSPGELRFPNSPVVATVTVTGSDGWGSEWPGSAEVRSGRIVVRLDTGLEFTHTTFSLRFSYQVERLSLVIADIDQGSGPYSDVGVWVTTDGFNTVARGEKVVGSGTSPEDRLHSVDGIPLDDDDPAGQVTVHWEVPLFEVRLVHTKYDPDVPSDEHISIGPIEFDYCPGVE